MSRLATLLALLWAITAHAAAVPSPPSPGEHVHVVAAGETLASLATQYYGAAWKAVYLTARNGLSDPKDVTAGTRLVVPATYTYRVRKGDTAAELGKKQLGERERGKAILLENGLKPGADLPVGVELILPFHLKYAAEAGDTWARLAARYYASAERAGFLKDYNPGVTLAAGARLVVPIFDRAALDVQSRKVARPAAAAARPPPAKTSTPAPAAAPPARPVVATTPAPGPATKPSAPAATPAASPGPTAISPTSPAAATISAAPGPATPPAPAAPAPATSPAMPSIAASLAAAAANPVDAGSASAGSDLPRVVTPALRATLAKGVEEYRQGEFESGCAKLEQVLAQGPLPAPERNTALAYLGFCAVAAGNRAAAADYFRKWLELDPRAELDPVTTSPKIRAIFQEVAESIRAEVSDAH